MPTAARVVLEEIIRDIFVGDGGCRSESDGHRRAQQHTEDKKEAKYFFVFYHVDGIFLSHKIPVVYWGVEEYT